MRMTVVPVWAAAAAVLAMPAAAIDMPETKVSMETCMTAALAQVDGKVSGVKLEIEDGKPLYEFKIKTPGRQTW